MQSGSNANTALRWLFWPIKALSKVVSTVLGLVLVVSFCMSMATAVIMAVSGAAFALVSSLIEGALDIDTNQSRARADLDRTHADLDRTRVAHADQVAALTDEIEVRDRTIHRQATELVDLRASQTVMYRGEPKLLRDAISDTTERVSTRLVNSTYRNVGSVLGEGLPLIGIAVAVTATGWEVKDACAMMSDMYELDISMNPENAVDTSEVCGMRVPTSGEVWQAIITSPNAVWEGVVELYDDLPSKGAVWESIKTSPGELWRVIRELFAGIADWNWSAPLDWSSEAIDGVGSYISDMFWE